MTITFVSSFLIPKWNESIEETLEKFRFLANTGIPMVLYLSTEFTEKFQEKYREPDFPQIRVIPIHYDDLTIVKKARSADPPLRLPATRNEEKDTFEYILYSHTKHELIERAIETDGFGTTHFAWIDFDISPMFQKKTEVSNYLTWFSNIAHFTKEKFICFPGCWSKLEKEKEKEVVDSVHWRFCGAYVVGDRDSMKEFCQIYREQIDSFIEKHHTLVWDFNFWAWMETFCEHWEPDWYRGDHNDSLVVVSADLYTHPLQKITKKTVFAYPELNANTRFYPTSASYLNYQGKHLLNTRYVNYWIYPNGCYLFHNSNRVIENKNMLSELDPTTMEPLNYRELADYIPLPISDCLSRGLEDIRLYEYEGKVKYMATTMGYSATGKSRMIVGDYDIDQVEVRGGVVMESPDKESWCEKNWIPIVKGDTELFIYKWFPLEIGKIKESGGGEASLEIIYRHSAPSILFQKIRGSTIFTERENGYWGVVHFSEEHSPRHYYHLLIQLNRETLEIESYSDPFCFEKWGIEFCIGFAIRETDYVFWISRHDRDPVMICAPMDQFTWNPLKDESIVSVEEPATPPSTPTNENIETVEEPVRETVVVPIGESVGELVVEPIGEPVVEPIGEPVVDTIGESVEEPVNRVITTIEYTYFT
jgi:hypothetical protein